MKVAIVQMDCSVGSVELNCSRIPVFAERAKAADCKLIVFPEMMDTGYEMLTVRTTASPWTGLPFMTAKQAAADFGIYLICGISERESDKIYNAVAAFNPMGELIGRYRKTHLFSLDPVRENEHLAAGDSLETVQIEDVRCGLQICYDVRFPEVSTYLVKKGAMALIVCSAWPVQRQSHWKTLTIARAIENQSYVIAANRIGSDGPLTFCGTSCIIDPYGDKVITGSENNEELLMGEITLEAVNTVRNSMPVFKDRREDLYKVWQAE